MTTCLFDGMSRIEALNYEGPLCECPKCKRERDEQAEQFDKHFQKRLARGCSVCGTAPLLFNYSTSTMYCPSCRPQDGQE